jgi:oligoribonuclease
MRESASHAAKRGRASPEKIMSQPLTSSPSMRDTRYDENNLVWVDMEMSGLNPDCDRVLEVAVVVTDSQLEVLAEGPVLALYQTDRVLGAMDSWNTSTHGRSGLTARVRESKVNEEEAENEVIAFLERYVPAGKSPMCGNSICQDRRFMARWLPRLEGYFHYRNLDVSTLKELARRWKPEIVRSFEKKSRHEALADIYESIAELKHYRQHLIVG